MGLLSLGRFITKRLIGKIKKSLITDLNGPYIPGYWEEDAENSGIIAICLKCKGTNKPFKINLGNNPNRIGNTTTLCNGWEKLQHLMVMIYLASGRKSEEGIPMKHPDIQGEFKVKPMSV